VELLGDPPKARWLVGDRQRRQYFHGPAGAATNGSELIDYVMLEAA